jgi:hypothetical protein
MAAAKCHMAAGYFIAIPKMMYLPIEANRL